MLQLCPVSFAYWYLLVHQFRANWEVNTKTGIYHTNVPSPTGIPSDPALAAYGVKQSHELAAHLKKISPPIERVYSSPFYRCIQTIVPTVEALSSKTVSSASQLKIRGENGLGEWYGKANFDHPSPAQPTLLKKLFPLYDEDYQPAMKPNINGESIDELHDRCAHTLQKIIEKSDLEGVKAILICTHAAPLIAIGRVLTGSMPEDYTEQDFRPFTCSLSCFLRNKNQAPSTDTEAQEYIDSDSQAPCISWKMGRGLGGSSWQMTSNGECSFLAGGEERGWLVFVHRMMQSY